MTARAGPAFPGRQVVAGAFLVLLVGFGIAYAFAAFFVTLAAQFGATRGEIALVFSIAAFLYFSLGLVSGAIADRFGPRPVLAAGTATLAAGLVYASQADALWQVYLGYGLGVGAGVGLVYVPAVAAVQRWYVRGRGAASGVAVSGIGVGTLIGAPAAAWLLDVTDWRGAWLALAAVALAGGALATWWIRPAPQAYGLAPDGDPPAPAGASGPLPGSTLAQAAASRPFWMLYASCGFLSFGLFLPFVHLVPYARDLGIVEDRAVFLVTLLGLGSTVGRFVLASAAGWLGRRMALAGMYAGNATMLALWPLATELWSLSAFAFLFGLFYGGFVATFPSLIADYFGPRALGGTIGALYTCVALGSLLGPPAAGHAFDLFGSYVGAILLGAGLTLVGAVLVAASPDPERWRAAQARGPA